MFTSCTVNSEVGQCSKAVGSMCGAFLTKAQCGTTQQGYKVITLEELFEEKRHFFAALMLLIIDDSVKRNRIVIDL